MNTSTIVTTASQPSPMDQWVAYIQHQRQHVRPRTIVKRMVKQGIPEAEAGALVARVIEAQKQFDATPEGRRALAAKFRKLMAAGGVAFLIFAPLSYATFWAASTSPGGGRIMFLGMTIGGFFAMIRGLIGWLQCRR